MGVLVELVCEVVCFYVMGGNVVIYYGLGVIEYVQGLMMVMGIVNFVMVIGNVGCEGVGVNLLCGQNNVQGLCDMGLFLYELFGYWYIGDMVVCMQFEQVWLVMLQLELGLCILNMFDVVFDGSFKGFYCQGEDIVQLDLNMQYVVVVLFVMECIVVQDIFLNEIVKYVYVLLLGLMFFEKDGMFMNVECWILCVCKVMLLFVGYVDWEVMLLLLQVFGYDMYYMYLLEIMDEIVWFMLIFLGVLYEKFDVFGSI